MSHKDSLVCEAGDWAYCSPISEAVHISSTFSSSVSWDSGRSRSCGRLVPDTRCQLWASFCNSRRYLIHPPIIIDSSQALETTNLSETRTLLLASEYWQVSDRLWQLKQGVSPVHFILLWRHAIHLTTSTVNQVVHNADGQKKKKKRNEWMRKGPYAMTARLCFWRSVCIPIM